MQKLVSKIQLHRMHHSEFIAIGIHYILKHGRIRMICDINDFSCRLTLSNQLLILFLKLNENDEHRVVCRAHHPNQQFYIIL